VVFLFFRGPDSFKNLSPPANERKEEKLNSARAIVGGSAKKPLSSTSRGKREEDLDP